MRKILKKAASVLCAAAVCLSLVPCVGYADDTAGSVKAVVRATEITNPNFDLNLPTPYPTGNSNNYNYWIRTGSSFDSDLVAPLYIRYDISSVLDPDGDGNNEYEINAANVLLANPDASRPVIFYDIPADVISLESMFKDTDGDGDADTYVAPDFDASAKLLWSNLTDGRTAFNTLKTTLDNENISYGLGLSLAYDLTSYIKQKISGGKNTFSVMLLTSHNNTNFTIGTKEDKAYPSLYVDLIRKPEVSLTVSQRNLKSPVTLTAAVTDPVGTVDSVKFYVDDTLYTTVTAGTNGVYTAVVSDLSKGSHTFKAVALSGETEKASAEQVFEVKAASENITNLYRAIVSNYSQGSKLISVTKAAADAKTINTNDKDGNRHVWYYQYDISNINFDNVKSIDIKMTYTKDNSMSLTASAAKGTYVIGESSTYDEITSGFTKGTELAYFAKGYSNTEVSVDVTDKLKSISGDSSYGNLLTVMLTGPNWGGMMEGVSPIYFTVTYKDTTPIDITDNGNDITITVNPSVYQESGNITVVTAMYNGDMLIDTDVTAVDTPDEYTEYTVSKAENTTKTKVFIFDGLTADKAPVPLLKTPWQSN